MWLQWNIYVTSIFEPTEFDFERNFDLISNFCYVSLKTIKIAFQYRNCSKPRSQDVFLLTAENNQKPSFFCKKLEKVLALSPKGMKKLRQVTGQVYQGLGVSLYLSLAFSKLNSTFLASYWKSPLIRTIVKLIFEEIQLVFCFGVFLLC